VVLASCTPEQFESRATRGPPTEMTLNGKRGKFSRSSGQWKHKDYDVPGRRLVGRIYEQGSALGPPETSGGSGRSRRSCRRCPTRPTLLLAASAHPGRHPL
jgi:hypothetical protein